MNENDEELILDFQSGNREAIKVIFERYKNRILNFCIRILGNRADAEDVTGDVFVTLFANRYKFDPNAKFSTWLFTIARNNCISRLRKKKNLVSVWFSSNDKDGYDQWDIPDDNELSREQLVKKEKEQLVREAIKKLPQEQREAIVLREYDKFNYEQIAEIMGCSLEKVKILIYRARENLRGHLSSFVNEG